MDDLTLYQAVSQLAAATGHLSDADMGREYTWRDHTSEGLRFALIGAYHELRDLAALTTATRTAQGHPCTLAQHVLAQYHLAYRDLQAVLLGVDEAMAALAPAEGQWPLRTVVGHMLNSDITFYALVRHAIEYQRNPDSLPARITEESAEKLTGISKADFYAFQEKSFIETMTFFDTFHDRVLREFAGLSDEELRAPSLWWEGHELEVRYRMHRFDAHLRQHTVQAEKTLAAIGHPPNEAKRLLRLTYAALAEAEGVALGATETCAAQRHTTATTIAARATEVAALVAP